MSNRLQAYSHLATQALRTGWYAALYRLTSQKVQGAGAEGPKIELTRPVPSTRALLQDVLKLQARDADNIRLGIYPQPKDGDGSLSEHFDAVRRMFADLPDANERRSQGRGHDAASLPEAEGLPDYYTQNFHFQSGGWLTAGSARIYDVQVETLFMGSAAAMRRQAIPPVFEFVQGKDQRGLKLLDVACGSGRFLGQLAQAFPRLPMTGVDLSQAYLDEAANYTQNRRGIAFRQGNAEALPFEAGSFDIVTCVYLYHEIPREVRRTVTAEILRILKPGGLFVLVDSLQWGDEPDYDGLLEAFPQRFHEPYYLDYLSDRLDGAQGLLAKEGLQPQLSVNAFLSKVVACRKMPV
jgi:ubiquinone/menaquinone biosynthesis C-methylase UbiE